MAWKEWIRIEHRVSNVEHEIEEIKEKMVDTKDLNPIKRRLDMISKAACWVVGVIMLSIIGAIMGLILQGTT